VPSMRSALLIAIVMVMSLSRDSSTPRYAIVANS
jgi:hypothetical protein